MCAGLFVVGLVLVLVFKWVVGLLWELGVAAGWRSGASGSLVVGRPQSGFLVGPPDGVWVGMTDQGDRREDGVGVVFGGGGLTGTR